MHYFNEGNIADYREKMYQDDKAPATIHKYVCDLQKLIDFASGRAVTRGLLIEYKDYLGAKYKPASANSIIAAANLFFRINEWNDCFIKPFRIQRESFRETERELSKTEYMRLIAAAKAQGKERLQLIMETICSTGIRVSELRFITYEAVLKGSAQITLKGKTRTVLLVPQICRKLKKAAKQWGIQSGMIFRTRSGRPVDRSNILHEMKALYEKAGVDRRKIFPHNLRHLFAVTFYRIEKDLAHLADILGHSNINTTRIYTATSRNEQIKVMEKMRFVLT